MSPLVTVIVDSQKKVTPEGKSLAQGHPDFQCVERLWDVLYSDGDRLKVTIELFDGYGAPLGGHPKPAIATDPQLTVASARSIPPFIAWLKWLPSSVRQSGAQ